MTSRTLFFILFLMPAATAGAQSPPAIEVRTAFGATNYLHGDLNFTAPTFLVSLRVGTPTIVVEPEFVLAWHESRDTFSTTTIRTRDEFQSIGINVVRRWPGSVAPYVGGGVGIFTERDHTETTTSTGSFVADRKRGPRGGVQALAGVDVRVNRWIAAFGQVRFEQRSLQDPAGGAFQGFGGIALRIH